MSYHQPIYAGCQCSNARCNTRSLPKSTLFAIFSVYLISAISSELRTPPCRLDSFPVEFHRRSRPIHFQCPTRTDGVRADEYPVLPRGEPAEDPRLKRLRRSKA